MHVREMTIYKLRRLLGIRSTWERLRVERLLRATVVGDRVEVEYLGRKLLPKKYVFDIYRAAEYWGLRTCRVIAREPAVGEIWYRSQILKSLGIRAPEAGKIVANSLFCTYGLPVVFERAGQAYPGAFDLLAEKVGPGMELTIGELHQLTRDAALGSLPAKEAWRLATALR
jgi:hypothetical protein